MPVAQQTNNTARRYSHHQFAIPSEALGFPRVHALHSLQLHHSQVHTVVKTVDTELTTYTVLRHVSSLAGSSIYRNITNGAHMPKMQYTCTFCHQIQAELSFVSNAINLHLTTQTWLQCAIFDSNLSEPSETNYAFNTMSYHSLPKPSLENGCMAMSAASPGSAHTGSTRPEHQNWLP